MKKLALFASFVLIAFASNAQFENNQFVLGGNVFYNNENGSSASNTLSISPMLGKAISENKLITAQFGYANSSSKSFSNSSYTGGLGFRRYYPVSDNLYFNWQGGGTFSYSRFENKEINTSSHSTQIGASVSPGLSWVVTPRLLLEARFGNVYYNYNMSGKFHQIGANFNNLTFGFTLRL